MDPAWLRAFILKGVLYAVFPAAVLSIKTAPHKFYGTASAASSAASARETAPAKACILQETACIFKQIPAMHAGSASAAAHPAPFISSEK